MRGIGGPLLCIGDLLNDVGEVEQQDDTIQIHPSPLPLPHLNLNVQSSHLAQFFQENYDQLNNALAGTDHSWTSFTLKLCTSLDTAKKLIESANLNAMVVSKQVGELEKIIKKGDSIVAEVRSIHSSLSQRITSSTETRS